MLASCSTTPARAPESKRMAAVVLNTQAAEQINAAVKTAFLSRGFDPVRSRGAELIFQRKGGFWTSAIHGDWYSGAVWLRARVYQTPMDDSRTLLECDLFRVQQPEDPFFEKEQKLTGKSSECQKLLNEVKQQLADPP